MKSLIAKVFGLLLTGFVVVTVVAVLLFWWVSNEINPRHQRLRTIADSVAAEVTDAYEAGTLPAARRQIRARHHLRFWLMDQDNNPLDGRPIPAAVLAQVASFPDVVWPYQNKAGKEHILAVETARQDRVYRVVMITGRRPFRGDGRHDVIWGPVALLLLALTAGSILLSLWVLKPLRIIRQTAGTISGYNLEARVPKKITDRRDAFGELGTEFNRMTSRLERSINGQRQLLRDISHDLRTPLARMQVASSLAAQKMGGSLELDRIDGEITRLNEMLESLLDLSRLRDQTELTVEPLDLEAIIGQIAEDAVFEFQQSRKQVEVDLGHQHTISGDPALLGRAVENVIRNALRFSPPDSAVSVTSRDHGNGIEITIADEGPGVAPAELEQIFEPFFQADSARTHGDSQDDASQVGVGLALTRAIVQLHGGTIQAENGAAGGLRVLIQLPVSDDAA